MQTEIRVGANKLKARVMELLSKRNYSRAAAKCKQPKDDEVTCQYLRKALRAALTKKRKLKKSWMTCKEGLEAEIKKGEEQAERLEEERYKRREYHQKYKSQQSVAHEMSVLYEEQEAKMSSLQSGKVGWVPAVEFNDVKAQLEDAQKQGM